MSAEATKHLPAGAAEQAAEAAEAATEHADEGTSPEIAAVRAETRSGWEKFKGLFFDTPEEKAMKAEAKEQVKVTKQVQKEERKKELAVAREGILSGTWKAIKWTGKVATAPIWWPTLKVINGGIYLYNGVRKLPETALWKGIKYALSPSSYKLGGGDAHGGGHGGGGH